MKTLANALGSATTWTRTTGLLIIGIGASDAWRFHAFGTSTDLVFITGAAAGLGVHLAMQSSAAKAAASTTPPTGA